MEIKKNVPMAIKEMIAESVVNSFFLYNIDDELIGYSEIQKEKALIYNLFEYYSDIEIPKVEKDEGESDEDFEMRAYDNEASFIDNVVENGTYETLRKAMTKGELNLIISDIHAKIEFKKRKIEDDNSLSKTILSLVQNFLDKAPDAVEMQKIFDEFKGLDLDKLTNVMSLKNIIS